MILYKKNFRDFFRNFKLFVMCILLTAIGLIGYCGMSITHDTLEDSKLDFYEKHSMADLFCYVEGIPEEEISEIEGLNGVNQAEGVLILDTRLYDNPDEDMMTIRLISYDPSKEKHLNGLESNSIVDFGGQNILIGKKFWDKNKFIHNKDVELYISETSSISVNVCGSCLSPDYLYSLRDAREYISDDKRFTVAYIHKNELEKQTGIKGICNQISIKLDDDCTFDDVRDELEDMLSEYGLLRITEQKDQTSYKMVQNEIDKIKEFSVIVSAMSMGIACLILYIIMSKIVFQEKKLIGIMKSFGYSNFKIITHYMTAGVINSLIGTVLGNIFGIAVAKKIMLPVYLQRINIPVNGLKISWITVLVSFVVPLATSILGIYIGARKVAHILPVEAMRAGVPVVTKYMPEMKFLSAHLSKSNFIGIRNMFRSPFRTVFMILGIGLCMGLTTCLYSIFGSLDRMMLSQFTNHQKYDLKIMFDVSKDEDHITEKLESYGDIRKSELIKEKPHKLINGDNEKDVMLTVLPEKSELLAVYNDIERKEEKLSDGLILSTNLAKVLKAEVGDKIKIADILGKEYVESEVTKIVNQSYGIQCFVKESVYEDLYNNDTGFNTVLIECSDKNGLKEKLLHDNEISSFIDVKDNYDNHQTFLKSFKTMLRIFFILSAVLSSIIIFSISIVSHMDRKYEFNTMQVIGYSPNEIVKTNYIENIVELVTGVIIGLPLALFMKKIITSAFVISEEIKMPDNVEPFSYVIGLCIIMTVFIISNIVSRISIERMNLSDALKERQ